MLDVNYGAVARSIQTLRTARRDLGAMVSKADGNYGAADAAVAAHLADEAREALDHFLVHMMCMCGSVQAAAALDFSRDDDRPGAVSSDG